MSYSARFEARGKWYKKRTESNIKSSAWTRTAAMTKRCASLKRPQGRPPAGAVLVDGKWQLTDRSKEIAIERLLRHRDLNRVRREKTRELLRRECPELFAHLRAPAEVLAEAPPARSYESQGTLWQYQKKD